MRKIYFLIICLLSYSLSTAQNNYVDDALRLSLNNYGGTARFVGMSGAFGALGGDFSSISVNPAGIGVYRSSEFVFSPGLSYNNNTSSYINNTTDEGGFNMNINNLGFVASYDLEDKDTRWVNFNVGVGINRLNNLNDDVMFQGVNNSSLMEVFVNFANADATPANPWDLEDMYEYLLWDAFILDSTAIDGVFYNEINNAAWDDPDNFEINQRKIIRTEGSTNEFNIAFGGNFAHKLYVGGNLNIAWLNYTQYSSHYEFETSSYNITRMKGFDFREHSKTSGTGVSAKLGAIFKPIESIRLGVAIHLPVLYTLNKEYYNEVFGYFDADPDGYAKTGDYKYEYKLQTPIRLVGSVGFQIAKLALIDIDYEKVNYSNIKLDDDLNSQGVFEDNHTIDSVYKSTHNIRLGAELRLGAIYLRGGGSYSTSPYVGDDTNGTIGYSVGFGYREKNLFIDAAFAQTRNSYSVIAYNWEYNSAVADIDNKLNRFVVTFGVRF